MAQIEIILTEKVGSLGNIGDIVNVKAGYAKHYLIPRKKALRANAENKEIFLSQKDALIKASADKQLMAESQKNRLDNKIFHVIKQASEKGHLYGSVSVREILNLLRDEDVVLENNQVILSSQIKELGIFAVKISLHAEVETQIILSIARSAEESEIQISKSKEKESKEREAKETEAKKKESKATSDDKTAKPANSKDDEDKLESDQAVKSKEAKEDDAKQKVEPISDVEKTEGAQADNTTQKD